jgi:hypothetical protein
MIEISERIRTAMGIGVQPDGEGMPPEAADAVDEGELDPDEQPITLD